MPVRRSPRVSDVFAVDGLFDWHVRRSPRVSGAAEKGVDAALGLNAVDVVNTTELHNVQLKGLYAPDGVDAMKLK